MDAVNLPTGSAWWVAQVDAGLVSGRLHRHGDPSTWIWGATLTSLDLALQGYIVKRAERKPVAELPTMGGDP